MFQALLDILVRKLPHLKNLLKRGDGFEEEFYEEKMKREGTFIDKKDNIRNFTFMHVEEEVKTDSLLEVNSLKQLYKQVFLQENEHY